MQKIITLRGILLIVPILLSACRNSVSQSATPEKQATNTPAVTATPEITHTPTASATPVIRKTAAPAFVEGRAISPYLVGNNVWLNPGELTWEVSSQAGLRIVRIGGLEYDKNFPSYETLSEWVNQIKAMDAEPMIQVSRFATPEEAAEVVRYFNIETGNRVLFWNIGNESNCNNDGP